MGDFFIRRPIVAMVIAIVMTIFGVVALGKLPVSQYPEIVPPEIQVTATYSGADAIAVEQSVTTPLEQKINGVERALYIRSVNSWDGVSSIRVSFEVGTNLDTANVLVQNRVSEGAASLPEDVKRLGVSVKKALSFPLMLIALRAPGGEYDSNFLSNYASINIIDELARIDGVGQVNLFGGSDYAMRVWIKPDQLSALGLTVSDVVTAIQAQNAIAPGGRIGADPAPPGTEQTVSVRLPGRLSDPEQFEKIIVKSSPDGSVIRLKDISRIELGAQSYNATGRFNGASAAIVAVYQTPGSNALAVATAIKETMARVQSRFPEGIEYVVSLDTTKAVDAGLNEIVHTFIEALLLVFLVVFVFLQNWRTTIIPLIAVPVSLLATFAIFPLLGFTVNTLSLLGLVLAIGVVVDDAIVVVEAVIQHMEKGLSPREATVKAMQEVTGPVIGTSLILAAVFVPVVMMEGITGLLYVQFAITIAVSVLLSSVNALTLSPALSALLLRSNSHGHTPGGFFRLFNRGFERFTEMYLSVARFFARSLTATLAAFAGVVALVWLSAAALPTGFVPEEDQGYILAALQLPEASSLERTDSAAKRVEQLIMATPGVDSVTTVSGYSLITQSNSTSTAFFFIWLKPWDERGEDGLQAAQIAQKLSATLYRNVPEGQAFAFGPPAIPGLGTGSGFSLMLQDRGGNPPEYLAGHAQRFIEAAAKRPEIGRISTPYRTSVPQIAVEVNREKVLTQGIRLPELYQTIGSYLGGAYVNDFNAFGRLYKVYVQAEPQYRDDLGDLRSFFVRTGSGEMASLAGFVQTQPTTGPEYTNRFNLFRAAELTGVPAAGFSSTSALNALEEVAREVLPADMSYTWNAVSYQERNADSGVGVVALGVLFVFLILAALYESWRLPWSVLLGTPFALLGAFGTLVLCRVVLSDSYVNNVFAQIGVLTLVGLAAKNAILIVEFARLKSQEGLSPFDAAMEAAKLRLRPIMMTALAMILGVLPLVFASGAGAEARKVIGMVLLGGMSAATFLGLLLVPALYVFIERIGSANTRTTPVPTQEKP